MEALESGPMTSSSSDPLLSAALSSRSPAVPSAHAADDYRTHLTETPGCYHTLNGGRISPHTSVSTSAGAVFNQYTTLQPLQPLPPISTVTNSAEKFGARASSPAGVAEARTNNSTTTASSLFFQQSHATNASPAALSFNTFAYNVNIKYEYDMKSEQDSSDETQPTQQQQSQQQAPPQRSNDTGGAAAGNTALVAHRGTTAEYATVAVTLPQQLQQLNEPFSPSQSPYVPSYSSVMELRASKDEKLCFSTTNSFDTFGTTTDILEAANNDNNDTSSSSPLRERSAPPSGSPDSGSDMDELNTKDLAQRISAELKRYSIPQAIFAQRVLCRSQGTLSDLLRNPKPWSKLKSGRETFRRMAKWLQEPEFQRMSALRLAACKRKEEQQVNGGVQPSTPKKPRLVFTDIQRRTLQAIFKETKRPSREMQLTISQQLQLDPTTVANFFMNARRRGHDRSRQEEEQSVLSSTATDEQVLSPLPPPPVFEQL
ncbi:Hepatocyte nuclear factor 6 [Toxocara canis]|uniref:One cut domain family member n=1 Tax=Toxocara canis TaxID=6265 RepID=A0A0B2UVB3_TOXCA|nr:Hepatocyte nuclear factor 6 [Toxocara canis]